MQLKTNNWRDISPRLGFPAHLNLSTGEIKFGSVSPRIYIERKGKDLERVWARPITKNFENKIIHRIYRYVGDSPVLKRNNLKLDITVILPGSWAGEFIKTTGHYHLSIGKNQTAPPDLYQLVFGKGIILIQKEENKKIIPYIIQPKLLEPILIPPEYAHTIINIGTSPMVFQNICVRIPHLNYKPILNRKGMAYFIKRKEGKLCFIPNLNYSKNGYQVEKIKKFSIYQNQNPFKDHLPFYQLLQTKTNINQLILPKNRLFGDFYFGDIN